MATYKVLQDIEAEDKFLGPLTLKQFIYAAIMVLAIYISFLTLTRGTWIVAAMLSPIILFAGFLAWPWSKDQPTEVWLLAKIRFALKPRRRIWDQTGLQQLVTITAPKRIERQLTNGLSQNEVESRLQALANTLDSRGWAIKNVNVNLFSQPSYVLDQADSDRLIDPTTLPQDVPSFEVTAMDDVLDERSNPTAQQFDKMMSASAQAHRQEAVDRMKQVAANPAASQQPANYWFMNEPAGQPQPGTVAFTSPSVITPGTTVTDGVPVAAAASASADEQALLEKIHRDQNQPDPTNYHMRVVQPVSANLKGKGTHRGQNNAPATGASTSTPTPDPAILELANNDDLNVATIARQADKARKQPPQDEVVISLH